MPDKKIKAVLFDLGETLINFGKVNTTQLFRRGARLSYDFLKTNHQPVGNFEYYYWKNLILLRIRHWLDTIAKKDFDTLALLENLGTKKGVKFDKQQWRHFAWLWYQPLSEVGHTEPKIEQTLTSLKNSGLKLAILSNTFVHATSLEKHLDQFGILDFFPVRLYSYEFDFRKPDHRIFTAAAEQIGEKLENIMLVGDRIDNEVTPALKLGMTAVLKNAYTNAGKKTPPQAYRINQLAELPALIQKINSPQPPIANNQLVPQV